jgi:hypothetical protein
MFENENALKKMNRGLEKVIKYGQYLFHSLCAQRYLQEMGFLSKTSFGTSVPTSGHVYSYSLINS